ncbi:MAG TPA: hypothetical protein VLG67_02855 [Candidatus Saccharimonadales bacterium]|nr:hypothetical protein [Candidatus Saccharimonadales bacterium]
MDPQSLSNLDPKLKETYDRVMGAPSAAPGSSPLPDSSIMPQPSADAAQPANPTPSASLENTANATADSLSPIPEQQPQTVTINQPLPQSSSSAIVTKPHGHSGLIRIFYILGAIVFFVIYVFFWVKIFNVSLPF